MSISRQYELVYIAAPDTTEAGLADLHAQIAAVVDRFQGTVEKTEPWGRRRLAYEIGRHREGVYVLETLNGPAAMIAELDRRLRVLDVVIRHLVVRVDDVNAVATRSAARRKADMVARRLRRGLPPEPTESELSRRKNDGDSDDLESGDSIFGETER